MPPFFSLALATNSSSSTSKTNWLIAGIDTDDVASLSRLNPYYRPIWDGVVGDNRNRYLHTVNETTPLQGAALAIRVLRCLSIAMGCAAVACTYGIAYTLFPDRRWTGEGVVEIQASDNIGMLRRLGRDPLVIHSPSSREFMGLIRLMDRAVAAAPEVRAPALVLYGEKDEVTPLAPVEAAFAALGGDKRLVTYAEGWHMLFRDLQARTVWRDVADWIEEQR